LLKDVIVLGFFNFLHGTSRVIKSIQGWIKEGSEVRHIIRMGRQEIDLQQIVSPGRKK
jgi:hypothetical protein